MSTGLPGQYINIDDMMRKAWADEATIRTLKTRLSHASSYKERRSLQLRIRALTDEVAALYAAYLRRQGHDPATVFGTTKKPRTYAGLTVRMDISDDGLYFSNPGPTLTHSHRAWVRCTIDIAQKSPFSTTKTVIPQILHVLWVIPKRWTILDRYPRFGRIEYMASIPLIVTREFLAPSSGSTSGAKFGAYVDPYYSVEPQGGGEPSGSAIVVESDTTAHFAAGTYRFYSRTANVLDSATDIAVPDSDWDISDGEERLFFTDGSTYVIVRELLSGPHTAKYVHAGQAGITLSDLTLEDL